MNPKINKEQALTLKLPPGTLPLFQQFLRRLPRGSHRLIPLLERRFDLGEVVTARLFNGQQARVRSKDVLQRLLFWLGAYERHTTELYLSLIRAGMTVLDVGANVGYFTLIAAERVGRGGRVIAFEPISENHSMLVANVALNGLHNVTVEELAVADAETTSTIYLHRKDVNSGMASLVGSETDGAVERRLIRACSLDAYLAARQVGGAHVIKMDIQGGEGKAIDGLRQTLRRAENLSLLWELNPCVLSQCGDSAPRLLEVLESEGYRSFLVGAKALSEVRADEAGSLPDGCMLLSTRETPKPPRGWSLSRLS